MSTPWWESEALKDVPVVAETTAAVGQYTALGATLGSAIPGLGTIAGTVAGAIADLAGLIGRFFGRTLTSWQQQDEFARPVAKKFADATAAQLTPEHLAYFKARYFEGLRAWFGNSYIQPAAVQAQYLAAPEMTSSSSLETLIWLGLHFAFHAAPNFSEYEVTRRVKPVLGEIYGRALEQTEAQFGAASVAKLKAALAGSGAATSAAPASQAALPGGPVLGYAAAAALLFFLWRSAK